MARSILTRQTTAVVAALAVVVVAAAVYCSNLAATQDGRPTKSEDVVKVSYTIEPVDAGGKQVVQLALNIADGWHIYANPVQNEQLEVSQTTVTAPPIDPAATQVIYSPGQKRTEAGIGTYMVYEGKGTVVVAVQRTPGDTTPVTIKVKVQACCHLPKQERCLVASTVTVTVP